MFALNFNIMVKGDANANADNGWMFSVWVCVCITISTVVNLYVDGNANLKCEWTLKILWASKENQGQIRQETSVSGFLPYEVMQIYSENLWVRRKEKNLSTSMKKESEEKLYLDYTSGKQTAQSMTTEGGKRTTEDVWSGQGWAN